MAKVLLVSTQRSHTTKRAALLLAGAVAAFLLWQVCQLWFAPPTGKQLFSLAQKSARGGDWKAALRFARSAAEHPPVAPETWLLVAQGNLHEKRFADAVNAWEQVPSDSPLALQARLRAAETCLHQMKHLSQAQRLYREAVLLSPNDSRVVDGLAQSLAIEGRWSEMSTCLMRLIQLDVYSNFHLDLLVRRGEQTVDPQMLPAIETTAEDDVAARCARARLALQSGDATQARDQLTAILDRHADSVTAQLLMGRVLLELGADDELREWLHDAPAQLRKESAYWSIALSATQRWNDDGARRCAWEVLHRDSTEVAACLILGKGLERLGENELATTFVERAQLLERYVAAVSAARLPQNWGAIEDAVELSEELGLTWEAYGWCKLASRLNPQLRWPRDRLTLLTSRVSQLDLVRTDPLRNPTDRIDPSRFPLPAFDHPINRTVPSFDNKDVGNIRFRDVANSVGLMFQYDNGGDCLRAGLRRMFEFTGGGVGVVDFDRDGNPDLYLPQGGDFAGRGRPMSAADKLWQNLNGTAWREVTESARLEDEGFGQGICVGDVDNDGFPELLVLNVGANVLWLNNGDGTFSQSRAFDTVGGDAWSLSAALADLDDDGIADIYVANYLEGEDAFSRVCPDSRGVLRLTCQPLVFSPAPDQVLHGLGDGSFKDLSATSGIGNSVARGMGVIVGSVTGASTREIYVANDATANSHFVLKRTGSLRFQEEAFLRGTAVDAGGLAQASMGIAAADANGDARLDLFVTNFEGEANTLYVQQPDGSFLDRSQEFGLAAPSRAFLGFGTQFLDADLDGDPDLMIANGHVNDRRESGSQYQMRPQLFRNIGGRGFQEVAPIEGGEYFSRSYLGRGLATLDWNGDGRLDAAISHLDRPAALLSNESHAGGRWLQLDLVGTTSARDAIGATVEVSVDDRNVVRHLLAGDGYESSNQRLISLGLGVVAAESVALQVQWPSGQTQQIDGVPVDHRVVIIEGRSEPVMLTQKRSSLPSPSR